jgi:hypothetical protein
MELATCATALLLVASLVFGTHVANGGFYYDDWSNASTYRFDGFWKLADGLWRNVIPGRPVLAYLLPVPFALFGSNTALHLGLALVLGVCASTCFFAFLRALDVEPAHAGAMAVLSLLFPWSDAVRLWSTASMNNVAIAAYFIGTVFALRALAAGGRRAVLLRAIAIVGYLLSILVYEAAAAAILLSILLYRTQRRQRRAFVYWVTDVAVVLVCLGASAVLTSRVRHVGSAADRLRDIPHFTRDGLSILATSFLPPGVDSAAAKASVLGCIAAVLAYALARAREPQRAELGVWLRRAAAAGVGIAAAYVIFLGSYLHPASVGVDNRSNTFAGFAFAGLVYSLIMVATLTLATGDARIKKAVVLVATLAVVSGFVQRVRTDIDDYDRATALQAGALSSLREALPAPPRGSTIYVFGYPAATAPGIPVFWGRWDLAGAVKLKWDDPSLSALPIYRRGVVCETSVVYPAEFGVENGSSYLRSIFVDLSLGTVESVRSAQKCQRLQRKFRPGPLIRSDPLVAAEHASTPRASAEASPIESGP